MRFLFLWRTGDELLKTRPYPALETAPSKAGKRCAAGESPAALAPRPGDRPAKKAFSVDTEEKNSGRGSAFMHSAQPHGSAAGGAVLFLQNKTARPGVR